NDVGDRTALHAERDAAVHAARALGLCVVVRQPQVDLAVVLLARLRRLVRLLQTLVFQETGDLAHLSDLLGRSGEIAEGAAVFLWKYLDETRADFLPFAENFAGLLGA